MRARNREGSTGFIRLAERGFAALEEELGRWEPELALLAES
jgi:hypothetical protein